MPRPPAPPPLPATRPAAPHPAPAPASPPPCSRRHPEPGPAADHRGRAARIVFKGSLSPDGQGQGQEAERHPRAEAHQCRQAAVRGVGGQRVCQPIQPGDCGVVRGVRGHGHSEPPATVGFRQFNFDWARRQAAPSQAQEPLGSFLKGASPRTDTGKGGRPNASHAPSRGQGRANAGPRRGK